MRRTCIVVALAIAVASVGSAGVAQAKITCDGAHPAAEIQVDGLPAEPVANTEYHPSLTVPQAPPANLWPIVMFAHCGQAHDPGFTVELPGAGPVGFTLRFSEAGRWRATLMDRGGTFYSLGTFSVRRAFTPPEPVGESTGDGATSAVVIGGGLVAGAGLVLLALRRRRA